MKHFIFSFLLMCLGFHTGFSQKAIVRISDNNMASLQDAQFKKALTGLGLRFDYPIALDVSLSEEQYETINGLDTREVFNANLNVQYTDLITGKILDSKDYQLMGSAKNKRVLYKGLSQAVRKKKKQIQKDVTTILDDKEPLGCDQVVAAMKENRQLGQYQQALQLSPYAPDACTQVAPLRQQIYADYQARNCTAHLVKVKAFMAVDDYRGASREIVKVDPESDCSDDLLVLVTELDEKVQSEKDKTLEAYIEYVKSENRGESAFRSRLIEILIRE